MLIPASPKFSPNGVSRNIALPGREELLGQHVLTVTVQDYFQGKAFEGLVGRKQWPRFEARVEQNTLATLELVERHHARATFFFSTWVAERNPDLVREVIRRGHEVANGGTSGRSFRDIAYGEFVEEIRRSKDLLESIAGVQIRGYRVADHRLRPSDLWALEALFEQGYEYDSSLHPSFNAFHGQPWRRAVHRERLKTGSIWEVPLSSISVLGLSLPVAGGNWFRQLPQSVVEAAIRRWTIREAAPFVMYFRIWDLDPDQPRLAVSAISRWRHYRNGFRMPRMLESFLETYRFGSVAESLQLPPAQNRLERHREPDGARITTESTALKNRIPVTIVIPCYNEEYSLPYLANTLEDLRSSLHRYDLRVIMVDDGSRDNTYDLLRKLFGCIPGFEILRLPKNEGVAAAIVAGVHRASTEIVCSMDCDCTYDPLELANMIPLMTPGIDLVTASPYHPSGQVLHVPRWRLSLSKGASFLYRCVLRQRLHTYTSCFRVYRRAAVLPLCLRERGFLGVAELIGQMDLKGSKILEYPAILSVRMFGRSKMPVLRTIAGHLRLIVRFGLERYLRSAEPVKVGVGDGTQVSKGYASE